MEADVAPGGVGIILVAAGRGTRLGAGRPKALVPVGTGTRSRSLVLHALTRALGTQGLRQVVVVAPSDPTGLQQMVDEVTGQGTTSLLGDADAGDADAGDVDPAAAGASTATAPVLGEHPQPAVIVVPGGAERADSVRAGLAALSADLDVVLVHDAARAFTPTPVFDRVVAAVHAGHDAVVPALAVTDTVKQVAADGAVETVTATPDRAGLRAVQTPQGFRRATLERAHEQARGEARHTDDAGMVEATGGRVAVVPGDPRALKVTTPGDLELAARWVDAEHAEARPLLVVLAGLPGVGKTTLARTLCRRLAAAHVRVDTVEQALVRAGMPGTEVGARGYAVALAVAADQVAVRRPVVADLVNAAPEARAAWEGLALDVGARLVRVELVCSDAHAHRSRVEGRVADIDGHRVPTWEEVRPQDWTAWTGAELRIDTATTGVEDAAALIEEICR
ncbi:2-C-methyl-D-erythritol 4-phosphate cytidylyltransferase [uncultured Serinicoccus sp.]|uniref:2-C-methyl-D-erythritol 4-phosphate cytidylyltransferase n=1 Tax=uncultured Serinicoccus sp. TaxID=735514 RepID=UPI002618AD43|nr:2-C-methyl-D-erythritol 4-phosphate cytidylyltransferase [uncultured Serinicoccus sp.]